MKAQTFVAPTIKELSRMIRTCPDHFTVKAIIYPDGEVDRTVISGHDVPWDVPEFAIEIEWGPNLYYWPAYVRRDIRIAFDDPGIKNR